MRAVIKYGGNAMTDPALQDAFATDVVTLTRRGVDVVVVHGGGPQITAMLDRVGIPSEFRAGYRVTSADAVEVVRMVLTGSVQRDVVARIVRAGGRAVGLSGEDAGLFTAEIRGAVEDGVEVDLGYVGEVTAVDPAAVTHLLDGGFIPVVSSVAPDGSGQILNVNADAAAAAVAASVAADALVMLTDVAGLYADWPDTGSLIERIDLAAARQLLPTLQSGMIPKVAACIDAVAAGVGRAHIVDGRIPGAALDWFDGAGRGTVVQP
jgi:acetylglutamate kinase